MCPNCEFNVIYVKLCLTILHTEDGRLFEMAAIDHFNWTCMCNVRQKYGLSVWIMNELWSWFTSLVNVCRFPEMCYIEITITKIQNDYRCIILQILPISNFSSAQRYCDHPSFIPSQSSDVLWGLLNARKAPCVYKSLHTYFDLWKCDQLCKNCNNLQLLVVRIGPSTVMTV